MSSEGFLVSIVRNVSNEHGGLEIFLLGFTVGYVQVSAFEYLIVSPFDCFLN